MFWSPKKSPEGTWQDGRYTLIKTLGQGGFGITYLAKDTLLERKVALKEFFLHGSSRVKDKLVPPPGISQDVFQAWRSKFMDEARALARFSHASIVRVQDVFEESGTAFIVMEFLEGHTLMEQLRERGLLTPAQGEHLARQLLEALGEVHRVGLLHRDIKPDNLFMVGERPVLIDFGAARQLNESGSKGMTAILTPGFAPPEQYLSSGAKYGPPTDLYALAATLLFAMTAELVQPAHERMIQPEALPDPPRSTSSGFARALRQSLELRMDARPQTVQAFLAMLDESRSPAAGRIAHTPPPPAVPAPTLPEEETVYPAGRVSSHPQIERALKPLRDVPQNLIRLALSDLDSEDVLLIAEHLPEFILFDGKSIQVFALLERSLNVGPVTRKMIMDLANALVRLHLKVLAHSQRQNPPAPPRTVASPQGVPLGKPRASRYPQLARALSAFQELGFEGAVTLGGLLLPEDLAALETHFPYLVHFDEDWLSVNALTQPDPEVGLLDPDTVVSLSTALERLHLYLGRSSTPVARPAPRLALPQAPLFSQRFAKGLYHLWEAEEGVSSACFSRDGRLLALVLRSGTPVLLEAATRRALWTLPVTQVSAVAFDPSGTTLYLAHGDSVSSWHPLERRKLAQWTLPQAPLTHLTVGVGYWIAVDASGAVFTQALEGKLKKLYPPEANDSKPPQTLGAVQALALSATAQLMATASVHSGEVRIDKLPGGKRFRSFEIESEVRALALEASGRRLAVGSRDGAVNLWDVATGQPLGSFQLGEPLHTLAFNPNGEYLLASSADGRVALYKTATQNREAAEELPPSSHVWAALSEGGQFMAWGSARAVRLLQLAPVAALPASAWQTASPPKPQPSPTPESPAVTPENPPPGSSFPLTPPAVSSSEPHTSRPPPVSAFPPRVAEGVLASGEISSGLPEFQSLNAIPYRKAALALAEVELHLQMSDTLGNWLKTIVDTEGPIRIEEAYRRLNEATGGRKLGARLIETLEMALLHALARLLFVRRGEFLWPLGLKTPALRDRSALPSAEKNLDQVCDEELLAALQRVSNAYPHFSERDRFAQTLRLLGFQRLTAPVEERLKSLTS